MIELRNLNKTFRLGGVSKSVARNINFVFQTGEATALLGGNGAGKSTMLQMIAGTVEPDSGAVISDGSVSWPIGFAGSFHGDLSGAQNVRFVARVYGVDTDEAIRFCRDFADLGQHFHLPTRTYSSGMRSRLAFALSMAVEFDTYLIDEVMSVGDASFRAKCQSFMSERLKKSGAIIVSHQRGELKRLCSSGAYLEDGQLFYYPDVGDAIEHYQKAMQRKGLKVNLMDD